MEGGCKGGSGEGKAPPSLSLSFSLTFSFPAPARYLTLFCDRCDNEPKKVFLTIRLTSRIGCSLHTFVTERQPGNLYKHEISRRMCQRP